MTQLGVPNITVTNANGEERLLLAPQLEQEDRRGWDRVLNRLGSGMSANLCVV